MFRKLCKQSVFYAINRSNHFPQQYLSKAIFSSHIQSNDAFDTNENSGKYRHNFDFREKRLNLLKQSLPEDVCDTLSEDLIKADTVDQLIHLLKLNHNKLNNRCICETLITLESLTETREQIAEAFDSNPFHSLIDKALRRIPTFNGKETFNCFKPLIEMGIGEQSSLIRALIQRAREVCDDFSDHQIVEFEYLVKRMASNDQHSSYDRQTESIYPLSIALSQSLAHLIRKRILNKEINLNDTTLLISFTRLALEHSLIDIINPLLEAICPKIEELSTEHLFSLVSSLITIKFFNRSVNLQVVDTVIQNSLDKLCATSVSDVSPNYYSNLVSILTNIQDKRLYYRKELFDLLADCVVKDSDKFPNSTIDVILKSFNLNDHFHYGLMDYIGQRIVDNSNFLSPISKISVTNIVDAFTLPNGYAANNPNSNLVYDTIISCSQMKRHLQRQKFLVFEMLSALCTIGYYPEDFIRECVHNHFHKAVEISSTRRKRDGFLLSVVPIYQALCLEMDDKNEENKQLIRKMRPFIKEIIAFQHNGDDLHVKSLLLHRNVFEVCGGSKFVANNLFTEYGHHLPQVFAMNTDGSFFALDFDPESSYLINELKIPSNCKIMAVIDLTFDDYCRQPAILKARIDYNIKTLRKAGIIPIVVNVESFNSLTDDERKLLIMEKISESKS